jgi:hypothetical protein
VLNRLIEISRRRTQAIDADDTGRHLLENSRVLRRDLAPQTVTDQHRPTLVELLCDRVKICDMVGNRVDARFVAVAVPA